MKCVYFFLDEDNEKEEDNNKDKSNKTVSKYVKTDFLGNNEIAVLQRIKHLFPNCCKYFHVCEAVEPVKIAELGTNIYNLQSVNMLKDDHNMLLRYKDQRLVYLDGYLRSLSCSRKYIYLLIDFYKRILGSIDLLVKSNIVHNYIGFKTIVVNSFEFPILTNFRFSLDFTNGKFCIDFVKKFFIQYNPGHIYWAPEIHLLCYILTNKLSSLSLNNIEKIIRDINIKLNDNNVKLNDNNVNDNKVITYFSKYVNMDCDRIIVDILRFSGTWDQYALGITYLQLFKEKYQDKDKEKENMITSNNFVVMFLELLHETVNIVPSQRPTVLNTLAKYQQMIDNADINELYLLTKLIL